MLGQVLALTLLLLVKGQGSADHVVGISGEPVWLRAPSLQTEIYSVKWRMQSNSSNHFTLSWKKDSGLIKVMGTLNQTLNHFNQRFNFTSKDFTLLIKAAQPQDSGLYTLEVTNDSGKVWKHSFQVSVFDRVEKPHLVAKWKVLDGGICQVTLSCSVARGGNVSYAWYRGTELIQPPGNRTELEETVDVNGLHLYTCNVSNPVSRASRSLQLTQGCPRDHQDFTFLFILGSIMVLLVALLLGALTCYVCRRKRKQSRTIPEVLTIYEDVNSLRTRKNQEQKPAGEGNTIYSMIQSQSSASTSQDSANTLYLLVQPSGKTGSKETNHSPPFNKTIYEEVGKRASKAENPARLSRRELENFRIYS